MVHCCVPFCKSYSERTRKIQSVGGVYVSYHEFPNDLILQAKWLDAISRKDYLVNDKSRSSVVCSKHFKEDDFIPYKKGRRLRPGSIPSIFDDCPSQMQWSAPCPEQITKKEILDSPDVITAEENVPDIDITDNKNSIKPVILYVQERRKEIALEEKSRLLSSKVHEKESVAGIDNTNSTEPVILSVQKELRRKEIALEKKSRLLNSKVLEVQKLKRQLKYKSQQLIKMSTIVKDMEKELEFYDNVHFKTLKKLLKMEISGSLEPKHAFLLTQLKFIFSKAFRWPESVVRECVLLEAVCPLSYKTLIERNLMNLPSKSSLKRYRSIESETGVTPLIIGIEDVGSET